jgi:hypothetical protein
MNENDGSTVRGFDPDTAPDLSKDGWPDKFARAPCTPGPSPEGASEGIDHHPVVPKGVAEAAFLSNRPRPSTRVCNNTSLPPSRPSPRGLYDVPDPFEPEPLPASHPLGLDRWRIR